MFRLILSAAICLVVCQRTSPAHEPLLIQDGDYFPSLSITSDGLLMTGGRIDELTIDLTWGDDLNPLVLIEDGSIGRINLVEGNVHLRGGEYDEPIEISGEPYSLDFWAPYLRVDVDAIETSNSFTIQGWFQNGPFFDLEILYPNGNFEPNFGLVVGETSIVGDADADCDVDLDDLNVVRNNFGTTGPGDLNGSDTVNQQDVRIVRDNFNIAPFTIPPRFGVGSCATAVPEPSGLALLFALLPALLVRRFISAPSAATN